MRHLFLIVIPFAMLAAAACSDTTGPGEAPPYSLVSVYDGNPLPYTFPGPNHGCVGPDGVIYDEGEKTSVLVDGTFEFDAPNRSYTLRMHGRAQCVTPAGDSTEWSPYTVETVGAFAHDTDRDRFILWPVQAPADSTPNNYYAYVRSDTLTLHEPLYGLRRATFVR